MKDINICGYVYGKVCIIAQATIFLQLVEYIWIDYKHTKPLVLIYLYICMYSPYIFVCIEALLSFIYIIYNVKLSKLFDLWFHKDKQTNNTEKKNVLMLEPIYV